MSTTHNPPKVTNWSWVEVGLFAVLYPLWRKYTANGAHNSIHGRKFSSQRPSGKNAFRFHFLIIIIFRKFTGKTLTHISPATSKSVPLSCHQYRPNNSTSWRSRNIKNANTFQVAAQTNNADMKQPHSETNGIVLVTPLCIVADAFQCPTGAFISALEYLKKNAPNLETDT